MLVAAALLLLCFALLCRYKACWIGFVVAWRLARYFEFPRNSEREQWQSDIAGEQDNTLWTLNIINLQGEKAFTSLWFASLFREQFCSHKSSESFSRIFYSIVSRLLLLAGLGSRGESRKKLRNHFYIPIQSKTKFERKSQSFLLWDFVVTFWTLIVTRNESIFYFSHERKFEVL